MNHRRRIVVGIAGMLATPPIAFALKPQKMPRIVWFTMGTPESTRTNNQAFREGLRALGYVEGKNIVVEYRFAHGKVEQPTRFELAVNMKTAKALGITFPSTVKPGTDHGFFSARRRDSPRANGRC